jgi:formyltetrahydrofolate deformylase
VATHILRFACPDRPGIVAGVAADLLAVGANILENAQFGDETSGIFCMRTRFTCPIESADEIAARLRPLADELTADMSVMRADHRPRLLLMVSRHDHCLHDLLYRWRANELKVDIAGVVSNHPDLASFVSDFGLDFLHVPVTSDTKPAAEERLLELIDERRVNLVVLARYMQILSDDLCTALQGRAINIHHSFLPGFKGARPYHQAFARGVKLIGATAHYVTGDLDEGPIIAQDIARVNHSHDAEEMTVIGKDVERLVLSRAVLAHVEGRVFLLGDRTVVFP